MRRIAIDERGELTRAGRALAIRTVILAALLVVLGFTVGEPIPAVAFAVAALVIPGAALLHLRRQVRQREAG